jgi:hypothetical protein
MSGRTYADRLPGGRTNSQLSEEGPCLARVREGQEARRCPSPNDVREKASGIHKVRAGLELRFGGQWWRDAAPGVCLCPSQKEAESAVESENLAVYSSQTIGFLRACRTPGQTLDMDESSARACPSECKRKCVFFITDCPNRPFFGD